MKHVIRRREHPLRRVLFLCREDYSLGRFCEEYFNSIARKDGRNWMARSRAVAPSSRMQAGSLHMDPLALKALRRRGAAAINRERIPAAVSDRDIEISDVLIGVALSAASPETPASLKARCKELWEPGKAVDAASDSVWSYLAASTVDLLDWLDQDAAEVHAPARLSRCIGPINFAD
jgi:hypothetical protein